MSARPTTKKREANGDGPLFGAPLKRKEDPRLLRGDGRYIADLRRHGMLSAVVVRSPHPHARIQAIDASAAREDPRTVPPRLPIASTSAVGVR